MTQSKKIALALGAGGSKGLSHIGVIKTLEKHGIVPDIIVGSSIGALIGGLYATGKTITEIEEIAVNTNWQQLIPLFFDPDLKRGILKGNKLRAYIQRLIGEGSFASTRIQFGAVATDMTDAKAVCLTSGDFAAALRASISVPIILHPEIIDNKIYVDGGLSVPVPAEFARDMGADIVIGVNLFEDYQGLIIDTKYSMNAVSLKSTDVLIHYLARENVKHADVVISPHVGAATLFNKFFTRAGTQEIIAEGENAMEAQIPFLKMLIERKAPSPVSRLLRRLAITLLQEK